jgi:hypothetical protein
VWSKGRSSAQRQVRGADLEGRTENTSAADAQVFNGLRGQAMSVAGDDPVVSTLNDVQGDGFSSDTTYVDLLSWHTLMAAVVRMAIAEAPTVIESRRHRLMDEPI